jgi:6-phosphogluconolactonase
MGEDGHVASLFTPPIPETDTGIYINVKSPKPPPDRITLTYPVIDAAKEVWVLASGAGKEIALCDSLSPDGKTALAHVIRRRPLTRVLTNI